MNSRRQSTLPAKTFISFPGTMTSALRSLFRSLTSKLMAPAFQPHRDGFLMSDMLLVHHTVRGARRLLIFPVTIPRSEGAIRYSVLPMGSPSSQCGVGCSAPYPTNSVKSGTSRLYSAGPLNYMNPGKTSHRPLTSLHQHPYFPIRTWESGTIPMVKTLK